MTLLTNAISTVTSLDEDHLLVNFQTSQPFSEFQNQSTPLNLNNKSCSQQNENILCSKSIFLNQIRNSDESSLRPRIGNQKKHFSGKTTLTLVESTTERAKTKSARRATLIKKVEI